MIQFCASRYTDVHLFLEAKEYKSCSLLNCCSITESPWQKSWHLSIKISHRRINRLLVRQPRRLFREIRLSKNFHDDIFVCPRTDSWRKSLLGGISEELYSHGRKAPVAKLNRARALIFLLFFPFRSTRTVYLVTLWFSAFNETYLTRCSLVVDR